ncbi:phage terminase large subunit-like protein [Rhizobium sp. BE258]|nr:terminase TerL endonuclease subunit [Rhizobium sp. BE258]MDR7147050.1 phage terminase large subunit-like protein [Rhizobium sp. BE258]
MLKHPKSRLPDKAFQLDPPFERIVRAIYGPADQNGARTVRTVYLQVGKGSRKTSLSAALALLHTYGPERVPRGQNFVVAADKGQARVAFEEAMSIVDEIPQLAGASRPVDSKNRLTHPKSGSFFEAMASDGSRAHARTPMFVLVDELWAHKKADLWQAMRLGASKVAGSLVIVATTAGRGNESPDFPVYEYAKKVQRGEIIDPTFLPIIFEGDPDEPWDDESTWAKVLPGLAYGYPDLPSLRQLAIEAKERPSDRAAFEQFFLGIRQDNSLSPFVEMRIYDEGFRPVDLEEMETEQHPCWLAVDLSSTSDLTVIVACWRIDDEFMVWPWYFCPGDNLQRRADRDGVPYPQWAKDGFITATSGNVVDFDAVENQVRELAARFNVQEVAFDPHLGRQMMSALLADDIPVVEFRQGWVSMGPAVKELERAIVGRNFRHGAHPVLRWNFDNVAMDTSKTDVPTFHKGKSKDRIDGAVATAMAVARCAEGDTGISSYETFQGDLEEWSYV